MQIVSRKEWGARQPTRTYSIATPTAELWLHHTAGSETQSIRSIQNYHMDGRGWSDIAYSYLIDSNGVVYEGRGHGIAGGHTQGRNTVSHGIALIGNYETSIPSQAMMSALSELISYGYNQGWWPADITGGHRDAPGALTACPGKHIELPLSLDLPMNFTVTDIISYCDAAYANTPNDLTGKFWWIEQAIASDDPHRVLQNMARLRKLIK